MTIQTSRVDAVVSAPPFSRISWGSIFAGTVCAFAVQLLFNLLGLGIGLAAINLSDAEGSFAQIGIGAGLWWGLSAIISLLIGGWVAGRLAGVPIKMTAMIHGFAVWALATLLAVWLATTTLATAVSGAFGAVGQVGQATSQAISGSLPSAQNINLLDGSLAQLVQPRTDLSDSVSQRDSVRASIREEAREMIREVVSRQEQRAAVNAVQEAAGDVARTPGDAGQDLNALLDRLFASDGVFSDEDRQEAILAMEQRLGISAEEAEQIINNWQERYQAAVARVSEAISTLQDGAEDAAVAATDAVGAAAGWTSLALFLGLVAAVLGGLLGKPEPWMVEVAEDAAD